MPPPVRRALADPAANLTKRMKFAGWDALADAAGALADEITAADCRSAEDWKALVGRSSLAGVARAFRGGGACTM